MAIKRFYAGAGADQIECDMKCVAELLNAMLDARVISDYAIFGAVAQMRYTEAVVTLDADILVGVPDEAAIDVLTPIYRFCRARGYFPEGESVRVGNWPVQFMPAFDAVTRDAMANAETADIEGVSVRVVSALYLAVIALGVGRAKDFARMLGLIESGATNPEAIAGLAGKYGLTQKWIRFKNRFLSE